MPTLDFNAGSVVGGAVARCLLRIGHYWDQNEGVSTGQWLTTPSFNVGDCYWRIYCAPDDGCTSTPRTYLMSISIALDGRVAKPIKAHAMFSLLDQYGEPVPGMSTCTHVREHSQVGDMYDCGVFIHKVFLERSEHVLADCFTIACDISVYRSSPLCNLPQHLLDTGVDVLFQVAGKTFGAHRCVLAARLPVLEAELSKASTSRDSCIQIDDVLPQVFKSFLYFVYTDSLPAMTRAEEYMTSEHLLAAADRFDMQELKLICEEKLIRDLNENTAAKILKLAVQHHSNFLKEACIQFLEDPPLLEVAMAMDDDILEQVAKICPALLKKMWAYEDDPMQDELSICLDEFDGLI